MKIRKLCAVLSAAVTAFTVTSSAFAANGDIIGCTYNSDILTIIDGVPIVSYSIDGRTVIPLEELEKYGYAVYYNDDIRTVFVTHSSDIPDKFVPDVSRGEVGGISGYIYESDITAYLNGVQISTYAIDGQVAAVVEEIGAMAGNGTMGERYRMSDYGFNFDYYDSSRLLSLKTRLSRLPDKTEREDTSISQHGKKWEKEDLYTEDNYDVLVGTDSSGAQTIEYFGDDHLYIDIAKLLKNVFQFTDDTLTFVDAGDGVISFKGTRKSGKITDEKGTYEMELPSLKLTKVK